MYMAPESPTNRPGKACFRATITAAPAPRAARPTSDREVGDPPPREAHQRVHRPPPLGLRASGLALGDGLDHSHEGEGHGVRVPALDRVPRLPHDEVADLPHDPVADL